MPFDEVNGRGWYCFKCSADNWPNGHYLRYHLLECPGTEHIPFLDTSCASKKELDLAYEENLHNNGIQKFNHLVKRKRSDPNPAEDSDLEEEDTAQDETGTAIHVNNGGNGGDFDDYGNGGGDDEPEQWEKEQQSFDDYWQRGDDKKKELESDSLDSDSDSNDDESESSDGEVEYDPSREPEADAKPPHIDGKVFASHVKFQIDLLKVLGNYRVPTKLHDDLVGLLKRYSTGRNMNFSPHDLQVRKAFVKKIEEVFQSTPMKPKDKVVKLTDGSEVSVSTYDIEAMILSLLLDEDIMSPENLAEGCDIFTRKPTEPVTHYGEVHTGKAWEPARKHYCGEVAGNVPIGLIIFGDKTHFDHNGTLCTTPVMFTLTCFNEAARTKAKFWRPILFIPNLDYCVDPNEKKPHKSTDSVQDEHICIAASLESLADIHRKGGIKTNVLGRDVVCKVWIHFVIGDTSGNNRWVGHFNGSGKLKRPYRDCKCPFDLCAAPTRFVYISQDKTTTRRRRRGRNLVQKRQR